MIATGLRDLLLEQPSITGIAAPQVIESVQFPGVFNRNAVQGFQPPFVILGTPENDPMGCMDGTYGLQASTFEIQSVSRSYPEALQLALAVSTFLKDYTGPAGNADVVKAVNWAGDTEDDLDESQGGDQQQYTIRGTYKIFHQLVTD